MNELTSDEMLVQSSDQLEQELQISARQATMFLAHVVEGSRDVDIILSLQGEIKLVPVVNNGMSESYHVHRFANLELLVQLGFGIGIGPKQSPERPGDRGGDKGLGITGRRLLGGSGHRDEYSHSRIHLVKINPGSLR